MAGLEPAELDTILGLQLSVAWAGEKANGARLGWWDTDLTDAEAGGDLFARLTPKTAAWAGLEVVREAARRADALGREQLADADRVATLFHFGFALDEALQDRLAHHKRHGHVPAEVLATRWGVRDSWSKETFAAFLSPGSPPQVEAAPAGRRFKRLPDAPVEAALLLAAGLVPLGTSYALSFGPLPDAWSGR